MNFYASPDYLDAIAQIYFRGRDCCVEDVRIGEDVLRLLVVDNRHVICSAAFLDYHQPLTQAETGHPSRTLPYAKTVVRRIIEISAWKPGAFEGYELAPFVDWQMFPAFAEYRGYILERNKGLIKDRERRGRRLAEAFGPIAFAMHDERGDALETARIWKSRQLRETGMKNWFADERTMEFLYLLRQKGLLTVSTLRASHRLLAVWVGFVHNRVWSGWLFTYDPDLSKFSPGHQLLNAMLEESFMQKHMEFDFSAGAEDYKLIYATHGRLLGSIGTPPLAERLIGPAKSAIKKQSPKLVQAARALRKEINRLTFRTA